MGIIREHAFDAGALCVGGGPIVGCDECFAMFDGGAEALVHDVGASIIDVAAEFFGFFEVAETLGHVINESGGGIPIFEFDVLFDGAAEHLAFFAAVGDAFGGIGEHGVLVDLFEELGEFVGGLLEVGCLLRDLFGEVEGQREERCGDDEAEDGVGGEDWDGG